MTHKNTNDKYRHMAWLYLKVSMRWILEKLQPKIKIQEIVSMLSIKQ